MPELALVNGKIVPLDQARVPIEDRGYQFGDAIYDVIDSYAGKLFCLDLHLDRMERSMKALSFPPIPREKIRGYIVELFEKAGIAKAGIYVQISRGVAPRNHGFPRDAQPQIIMTIRSSSGLPLELTEHGVKMITVPDLRWGRCDIKTVQLLPNVLAKQQALNAGAFDAIFIAEDGVVREATSSNLFIAKNGVLFTHPLTQNILPGISRRMVLAMCEESGIEIVESFFDVGRMLDADEVFVTGTITDILGVVEIDGKPIGEGTVGPICRRLNRSLVERAENSPCP
jgi:D-alanine transaminase